MKSRLPGLVVSCFVNAVLTLAVASADPVVDPFGNRPAAPNPSSQGGTSEMTSDGPITFKASGSVDATFGADLDWKTSGIKAGGNNIQFGAVIGKRDQGTIEKDGPSDIYGDIKVTGLRIETGDYMPTGSSVQLVGDNGTGGWARNKYPYGTSGLAAYSTVNPDDWRSQPLSLRWDELKAKIVFGQAATLWLKGSALPYDIMSAFSERAANSTNFGFLTNAYDYSLFGGQYGQFNDTSAIHNTWDTSDQTPNKRTFFSPHFYNATPKTDAARGTTGVPLVQNASVGLDVLVPSLVKLNLIVGSGQAWDNPDKFSGTNTSPNGYNVSVIATQQMVENLTVKAAATVPVLYQSWDGAQAPQFGALLGYQWVFGELKVTPQVAGDLQLPTQNNPEAAKFYNDGLSYGLAGGLQVKLKDTEWDANVGFGQTTFPHDSNQAYGWWPGYGGQSGNGLTDWTTTDQSGSLKYQHNLNATVSAVVRPFPSLQLKGAVEYVNQDLFDIYQMGSFNRLNSLGLASEAYYDVAVGTGTVTPFVRYSSSNAYGHFLHKLVGAPATDTMSQYLQLGCILKVIDNAVVTLEWDSNDLTDSANYYVTYAADLGTSSSLTKTAIYHPTTNKTLGQIFLKASVGF